MDRAGVALLQARPDLRVVSYDPRLDPPAFHALLRDAAACALSLTPFGAPEAAAAPSMQVIARIGVGFDRVDVPAATAAGIPLCVAGTANARSVAEHAVFFIFALAKRSAEMDRYVRDGRAHQRLSGLPGEVHGKTVLVVGFGRIGTRTAPRCQALGMEVLVHDPYVPDDAIRAAGFEPAPDLDAALPRADFVTIHCPKNADTVGMFGASRLARMKPGAFLVNTARGGIVDVGLVVVVVEVAGRGAGGGTGGGRGGTCSRRRRRTPGTRCCSSTPCWRRRTWRASRSSRTRRWRWRRRRTCWACWTGRRSGRTSSTRRRCAGNRDEPAARCAVQAR